MKKRHLLFCAIFLFSANLLLAQTKTLDQYIKRATQHKLIGATNPGAFGYIFGTYWEQGFVNSVETAVLYDGVGTATISEVLIYFGKAGVNGTTDTVKVYVYKAGADSMPTTVLGSGKIAVKDITCTNLQPTAITITGGANVTGSFLVSFNYKNFNDTIGVYCNNPYAHDGKGENRTRGKLPPMSSPAWMIAKDMWGFDADCDVYVIPVMGGTVNSCSGSIAGISEPLKSKGLTLAGAFPNPAVNETTIQFSLEKKEKTSIKVFDILGNVVYEFNDVLQAGKHQININTSGLTTGNYYYTLSTEQTQMTSKFVVSKN